jgi:hypothetical protein
VFSLFRIGLLRYRLELGAHDFDEGDFNEDDYDF